MSTERAATGERLNHGDPTVPRQSASVILLRDAADGLELLLVQRNPSARFMGGYWVFPGGAVDAGEGEGDDGRRAAAVRELREEANIGGVDAADLVPFSRWITPELIKIRFDTVFFVVRAPTDARARVDGAECVDLRWTSPSAALESHEAGELALVFPTLRHLEELSAFATTDDLLTHARGREVLPVLPRVVVGDAGAQVFLPGEPGYPAG